MNGINIQCKEKDNKGMKGNGMQEDRGIGKLEDRGIGRQGNWNTGRMEDWGIQNQINYSAIFMRFSHYSSVKSI